MNLLPRDLLAVFLGGGAGALLRLTLLAAFPATSWQELDRLAPGLSAFPLSTFAVNCAGALTLGLLLGLLREVGAETGRWRSVRLLLGTGLMGGFTTYSAFAVQGVQLILAGSWLLAVTYILLSLAAGLLLATKGLELGALVASRRDAGT